jgi:hypothetical protein
MNTSQHAGNILEAWRFKDLSNFNAVLDQALAACKAGFCPTSLEAEREEVLGSIVEHIQKRNNPEQLPEFSGCAAIILLRHLSSTRMQEEKSDSTDEKLLSETFKVRPHTCEMIYSKSNAAHEAEPAKGRIRTTHDISSN